MTWQIEEQIRLACEQLGGGGGIKPRDVRRALDAIEAYLGAAGRGRGRPVRRVRAESGIRPLIRLAIDLGIEWHLLADGDGAGQSYVRTARGFLDGRRLSDRITALDAPDIEHCLFDHGFAAVYNEVAAAALPSPAVNGAGAAPPSSSRR